MERIDLTLPIVPSVNHCYITDKKNRRLLTTKAKAWMAYAKLAAKSARNKCGWTFPADGEKLVLLVWYYWPDKRRRDCHNAHKLLADALEGVLYADDKTVLIRDIDYVIDRQRPRVEVTLVRKADMEEIT